MKNTICPVCKKNKKSDYRLLKNGMIYYSCKECYKRAVEYYV